MKKIICLVLSAVLLAGSQIPVSASGRSTYRTHNRTDIKNPESNHGYWIQTTPLPESYPRFTPVPSPTEGTAEQAVSGFSFGYVDIPAGLPFYQNTEDSSASGVFPEGGAAYGEPVSAGWVKLVFLSASTQELTEAFVPAGDISEMHALAADALRSRLNQYQPVYYRGYPLPTVRLDLFSDAAENENPSPEDIPDQRAQKKEPVKTVEEDELPEAETQEEIRPEEELPAETQEETRPEEELPAETQEETRPEEELPAKTQEEIQPKAEPEQLPAADGPDNPSVPEIPWQTAVTEVTAQQIGACQALICWRGNGTADQYSVFALHADGSRTFLGFADGTDSYTTRELTDGDYSFAVLPRRLINGVVQLGDASQTVSVTIRTISWENAPTGVRAEIDGRDVTLYWEGNAAADQYSIYQSLNDSPMSFAGKTELGALAYTLHDLPDGSYVFQIRPRKEIDEVVRHGNASEPVRVVLPVIYWFTAVQDLKAAVSSDERADVVLTWRGNGKASRYEIFELTDNGETPVAQVSHTVVCVLPDVSAGTHSYLVRPIRDSGGQTEPGEASAAVTVDLSDIWKTAPWDTVSTANGQSITLSWTGSRLTERWAVYEQTPEGLQLITRTDAQEARIENASSGGHIYLIYPARGEEDPELGDPSAELFAVSGMHRAFGQTENGLVWTLDDDGTLSLYGSGRMEDFSQEAPAPWTEYREMVSTVRIDSGLTSVGSHAFDDYPWLSAVLLPEGLQVIGDSAFRNCAALTSVSFPETLTDILDGAFASSGLMTADLPEGLTNIGTAAFSGCGALTSVTMPDNIPYIGEYAFSDCPSLVRLVSY